MLERYIKRPFFFREDFELFFIVKKLENQVRNEIFKQMSLTSTLALDVLVRPMDAKGLNGLTPKGRVVSYDTSKEFENLIRESILE